jgi:CRP/FNR family transcriptional regulator, dissimilatory nitrate respiration regulator
MFACEAPFILENSPHRGECMNIPAYLDRTDFLRGGSPKSRERFAQICIPREVKKKQVLFHEGDKGNAFFLLVHGAIGLYKGTPDGKEVMIKVAQPGEPFAEVILFEQDRYPVTAVAIKTGLVFTIPKVQFNCLLQNEDFRNDFIAMLMRKQRYLADRIRYLTMHDGEDRFVTFIREQYGVREKADLALSKKDIAAAIGTTPETYSRLITRLIGEKKISISGKMLVFSNEFWGVQEDNAGE